VQHVSTPFLAAYAHAIVQSLVASDLLLLSGDPHQVAAYVAADLARDSPARSVVASTAAALIACPDVEELFADDDDIKAIMDDMGTNRG